MTVTPDKTVRTEQAAQAPMASHIELRPVLDCRAGLLATAAISALSASHAA